VSARREGRRPGRGLPRDERGASLAIVAVGMTVFIGMAALAVDLGMLFTARSQAQRTADAAALAAASSLALYPGDPGLARSAAEDIAARNTIMGQSVVVQDGDVTFPSQYRARVWVYRTTARNDPVPTIFARILGINTVDVSAVAAAEATPGSKVDCVLPIMLPDRWQDNGGNPYAYDPGTDYYNAATTGYTQADFGTQVTIRAFQNPGFANPSWYYPFAQPGMSGANDYRNGIIGANCGGPNSPAYAIGDVVNTEPGAMVGPTKQGFRDLINQDPSAYWDPTGGDDGRGCVAHPGQGCGTSPRIRPIPMFDPTAEPDPGRKPVTITNFAGLFVESISGNDIIGRFMGFTAVAGGSGSGGSGGLFPRFVRLVE
jgi:Flp pilus assembly protein TadG